MRLSNCVLVEMFDKLYHSVTIPISKYTSCQLAKQFLKRLEPCDDVAAQDSDPPLVMIGDVRH